MITCLTALLVLSPVQDDRPLIFHDFETGTYGWQTMFEGHQLNNTSNLTHVRSGSSALQFTYEPGLGKLNAMMLPVKNINGAKGLTCWIKAARATTVYISLVEQNEEQYQMVASIPANQWTPLVANFDDFERAESSKLMNGRLDVEKVRAIMVVDLLASFAVDSEIGKALFGPREGVNALWLDDFVIQPKQPAPPAKRGRMVIDSFDRYYTSWIPFQGVTLQPVPGKGLVVTFERQPGRIPAVMRAITPGTLAGAKEFVLGIQAAHQMSVVIRLEETDGEQWQAIVPATGGAQPFEVSVAFDKFTKADDSGPGDNKLSPEKVKSVIVADLSESEPGTKSAFMISKALAR